MRDRLGIAAAAAALFCLSFVACAGREDGRGDVAGLGDDVVATVDGRAVSVEDFQRGMERRGSRTQPQISTPEQREALLEKLIHFEVVAANARKAGYETKPEVVAALERIMVRQFQEDQLEARLEALEISDEEVAARYAEQIADYTIPEAVRAGVIFVGVPTQVSEQKRLEFAARAQQAHLEIVASPDPQQTFATIATALSDDQATRYRRGDSGWMSRGDERSRWEQALLEAAFELAEPGELAPVVEGERGFYVVQLIERRPSRTRPLDQVADAIRYQLLRDRRDSLERDFYSELRSNVNVEINRALLESLSPVGTEAVASPRRPPRLPSG